MSISKGVWLSTELIQDKKLSWTKKIILQEISQLSILNHGCIANNKHFSTILGISISAVSNAINQLAEDGYIVIDNSDTVRNYGRKITIHENVESLHENVESPLHENVESKDTNSNNTNSKEVFVEVFAKNKINTFFSKVNLSMCDKKILNEIGIEKAANKYSDYIKRNKKLSARLNKWLTAYSENSLSDIEYGSSMQSKAEIWSLQWEINQIGGLDMDYIEAEAYEN